MGAVAAKTLADLRHRRLQSSILAIVLFLAAGAATLALSVLAETHEPFQRAFASANGAHLVIDYDGSVDNALLAKTATTSAVTASAGPWPVTIAAVPGTFGQIDGQTVSGRPTPGDSIDRVTISAGRWWAMPGEVVLDRDTAAMLGASLGQEIGFYRSATPGTMDQLPPDPGSGAPNRVPTLRLAVVGIAASVSTPDVAAWMSPGDVAALAVGGQGLHQQMLYRVAPAATAADLSAAVTAITADLPADAVASASTYLQIKTGVDRIAQLYVPVLLAFSIFALLAAAFTIANVVSGIILTSYRDIGVMKAVGFTPGQVTSTLVGQILVPVVVGSIAGAIAGTVASGPIVGDTASSFGLPRTFTPDWSVVVVVPMFAILVSTISAVVPALKAGRLSTVAAITRGTAPSLGHDGGRLRRAGLRMRVGLPSRLGIALGVSHPIRAAMTLGALIVGVASMTFALGLDLSLVRVKTQTDRSADSPVRVEQVDPAADPASIGSIIAARSDTARSVGLGQVHANVPGLGAIPFVGYDGDASWVGYAVISGRWFQGPGEVVATSSLFSRAGLEVGDTITLSLGDRSITERLVGEIFDTAEGVADHVFLRGSWADVLALDPTARPSSWEIQPVAETSPGVYANQLEQGLRGRAVTRTFDSSLDTGFLLFLSVVATMGFVLVAVSIAGVFDVVVLETRQRAHDMAILKAVGMTPRQVVTMVVASVVPVGLVAGLVGVPVGMALQRIALGYMGQVAAETRVAAVTFDVFTPLTIVALSLVGLAIAAVGAYLPAQRAARAPIAPILQGE